MTPPDTPRIVDHSAHRERVGIDQQIRTLVDRISTLKMSSEGTEIHSTTRELLALIEARSAALRREVGWPDNPR
ncbi:hypothetical protein [Nocardia terpenica]|uniref:hypothetical protein n=1 Tax=Nocardia terpenica TaxID=455432 RepID=UPI0002DEA38E|nr:hypothetical protein [Nocardia terpenica]